MCKTLFIIMDNVCKTCNPTILNLSMVKKKISLGLLDYRSGVSECDRDSSIIRSPWPPRGCCTMVKKKYCWILMLLYERCTRRKFSPNRIIFEVLISNRNWTYKAGNDTYRYSMGRDGRNKFLIAHFHSERPISLSLKLHCTYCVQSGFTAV